MPPARAEGWRRVLSFPRHSFGVLPGRLYNAWMIPLGLRPHGRLYVLNDPGVARNVLTHRVGEFTKPPPPASALTRLLGASVLSANGADWERQRRVIDPAFEGGRIREIFPAMLEAGAAAVTRLAPLAARGPVEIQDQALQANGDLVFRCLYSRGPDDPLAAEIRRLFGAHLADGALVDLAPLAGLRALGAPWRWRTRNRAVTRIRALLREIVDARLHEISRGAAPDDLASRIMVTVDPVTGMRLGAAEMVDQSAALFVAGQAGSAPALAWALHLLALHPEIQDRAAAEARAAWSDAPPDFRRVQGLGLVRDVLRETLRLYPPMPFVLRHCLSRETFRQRPVARGARLCLSTWHMQRHTLLWEDPDRFDPDRWSTARTRESARRGYLPFSAGPRVCPAAAFAMVEGIVLLAQILRSYRLAPVAGRAPVPVHGLGVRSKTGIWLEVSPRDAS